MRPPGEPHQTTVPTAAVPLQRARQRVPPWAVLACILALSGTAIVAAMRTTSTTFDEIVFIAAGARGYETGMFDLAPDHPPLMQYVYGLPVAVAGAALPDETGVTAMQQNFGYRYRYASAFFWGAGNDPERVAFLGRLPAVIMALALVLVAFFFTRRHWGTPAGLFAAALVAFMPDVLAHGGVAYSDLPVTLALFSAAWAIDEAVRAPSWKRGILAGALTGLAFGVKMSAAALVPLAAALVAFELVARHRSRASDAASASVSPWLRHVGVAAAVAVLAAYAVIVIIYRGDILLEQFRFGLAYRFTHLTGGHGAAAFLLGDRSTTGWWYFFPVAFLFKSSAALHLLLVIALIAFASRVRAAPARVLTSGLRVVVLGILIFGAVLLTSSLNIGFRYAMPVLPWLCVLAAAGTAFAWHTATKFLRSVIVVCAFWAVVFPLTYYPHFLSFISEYGPGRDRNHTVLVDSSLDWGQGLLELRDFIREHEIPSVYLSYFGSAAPGGYGIAYVPLASFFPLPSAPSGTPQPRWLAISATNLQGVYLPGDPFARFRDIEPDAVLANSILVYRLERLMQ